MKKFNYTIIAAQEDEEYGAAVAVKTTDYPDLIFSFAKIHPGKDESGNSFIDYEGSILGKNDLNDDLNEYMNELFMCLLTENTDLNIEDLFPADQV